MGVARESLTDDGVEILAHVRRVDQEVHITGNLTEWQMSRDQAVTLAQLILGAVNEIDHGESQWSR